MLREQALGKIHPLRELGHLAPHGFELLLERLLVLGELGAPLARIGLLTLATDALGERLADRGDGKQEQRATPKNEYDRENAFDVHDQRGGARRSGARSFASRRSVKSSRSSTSVSRRLSSSTSASSVSAPPPSTTPCFAAFMAIQCSSVFDHPRIHSASAFPTGPVRTTVEPMTSARPIMPTAGTHIPMRRCPPSVDRKSTRLNSSHSQISYA